MALLEHRSCLECGETYFASSLDDGVCPKCIREKKDAVKREALAELEKLSLEERVRKLEEEAYDRRTVITVRPMKEVSF